MNKPSCFFAPLLTAVLLPTLALAEPSASPAPPGKGEQRALNIFHMLDADGDGRISRAEAALAIRLKPSLAELFRDADANGDGYLTQAEIRAAAERRRAERLARQQAGQGDNNVSGR